MELPVLHRRAHLLADGYTDDEVRRQRTAGTLVAIRPGTYLRGGPPGDAASEHAIAALAAMPDLAGDAVFSHATAAVLHGLPLWRVGLTRVHVTRARRGGGRVRRRVHIHAAPLDPAEIIELAGMPVTSLARTVADLGRSVPFEQGVVLADGALRTGLVDPTALADAVARVEGWPGSPAARRVVAFADGRSGSVGESRSRVAIHRAGLPVPVLQWEVIDACGRLVGRTDFGWPEWQTVGEFDGLVKYGRLLRPGQSAADVLFDEKRREDALRDEGLAVVRWTWADLPDFARTATRLRRRFRPV